MECDLCKTRYTPGYVATETNYYKDFVNANVDEEEFIEDEDKPYAGGMERITITREIVEDSYDDFGLAMKYDIHMCPQCWSKKFLPWLKRQKVDLKGCAST